MTFMILCLFCYLNVMYAAILCFAMVQEYLEENSKISFLFNTEIEEIIGDKGKVTGVKVVNKKTGERKTIPIDGVYFAIGFKPNSEVVSSYLDTDEKGFIKRKDCSQKTSVEGVFVAGDVDDNPHRKAGVAVGNGVEAALDAMDFLQNIGLSPDVAKKLKYPSFVAPDKADITTVSTIKELRSILTQEDKPVLVDFYADYCSTCRALMPELDVVANEYDGKLRVLKVERNEKSLGLFDYFKVTSVPYYIIFENSQEHARADEVTTPKELQEFLKKFMGSEK